jgi:hypothetical protein
VTSISGAREDVRQAGIQTPPTDRLSGTLTGADLVVSCLDARTLNPAQELAQLLAAHGASGRVR